MENSPTFGKLFEALAKAQGVMEDAKKDSANPFFKSKYADLSSVWAACRKPLTDNGLSVLQTVDQIGERLCLITVLGHSSGEFIKSIYPIQPSKPDAQAMGSAITYARRYALAAIVGICQSDDDGEAAMNRTQEPTPKLNDEQVNTILTHAGEDKERISKILDFYNAKSLKEISGNNYSKIIAHLTTKPKAMPKRVSA